MNIALIGFGAIARYVVDQLAQTPHAITAVIVPPHAIERLRAEHGERFTFVTCRDQIPDPVDLFVDCAGHGGLTQHGPGILRAGHALLTVSIGALADADLLADLDAAAQDGQGQLMLVSGAIGALDALRAGRIGTLRKVRYTGRKPPTGWVGSPAEEVLDLASMQGAAQTHFQGTAREAALQYPKNANVAAAVALSGVGFDATEVALIADPSVTQNIHEVTAEGDFGRFSFTIEGNPLPSNPRSSALAAMSVIASIRQYSDHMKF